jgi:outer membrane lipoprotein SlyB
MNMPTRFIQRLGLWMSVCLLAAAPAAWCWPKPPSAPTREKSRPSRSIATSDHKLVNGGTVIGGIAGGVIGHQIGSGRGNTAATIAGALGGAVVGNEIEKKQEQATRYRITVRLDSGSSLIVEDQRDLNLRVGRPRAGR